MFVISLWVLRTNPCQETLSYNKHPRTLTSAGVLGFKIRFNPAKLNSFTQVEARFFTLVNLVQRPWGGLRDRARLWFENCQAFL